MKLKIGITGKLFLWYFLLVLIFYITIGMLYMDVSRMMTVSEEIVNRHYTIADEAKQLLAALLTMEENEQKFRLLKKEDYHRGFMAAYREFDLGLDAIGLIENSKPGSGEGGELIWRSIRDDLRRRMTASDLTPEGMASGNHPVIPETVSSGWMETIGRQRALHEQDAIQKNRELNRRGRSALRKGMVGLSLSVFVGLAGIAVLSGSMVRPLKKLRQGILSIARERKSGPVLVRSGDEFGELSEAFNDMARRLREEEKMRSDFIAALSHEIRTPLTSIRESVNLLAEEVMGPINPRQRKFLAIASDEIGRICELLNELMQASRLESNALNLTIEPLEVFSLFSGCVEKLHSAAAAKTIQVSLEIPPWTPPVLGDPRYLPQVVLNLLGNAIKFSSPGSAIRLQVATDQGRDKLRFSVTDQGPGIAPDELSLIFNQYYRARGVREEMDGAGLGLSIARRIIEAHSGEIGVQSTPGVGSSFHFTLLLAGKNWRSSTAVPKAAIAGQGVEAHAR